MQLAEPLNLPQIEMFLCRENWLFEGLIPFLLLMRKRCCHGPWEREIHREKAILRSLFDEREAVAQLPAISGPSAAWCEWHCGIREQHVRGVWARTLELVGHAGSLISTFPVDHFLCQAAPYCTLNRRTWCAGGDAWRRGWGWGGECSLREIYIPLLNLVNHYFFPPLASKED